MIADPMAAVRSEIEILKKMRHPNIVLLHEVINDPNSNYLYIVQEYVGGGAAMGEVELGRGCEPLPYRRAWSLFRDMLNGLEYLHSKFIVHRDLKPSNILMTKDYRGKIVDFGVSTTVATPGANIDGTAGSPVFMGPEVCGVGDGKAYSGQAADMYSAGVTLYSFVFGRVPFPGPSFMQLVDQKMEPLVFWDVLQESDVPSEEVTADEIRHEIPQLHDILTRLMQPKPQLRLSLQDAKHHAWTTMEGTCPIRQVEYVDNGSVSS